MSQKTSSSRYLNKKFKLISNKSTGSWFFLGLELLDFNFTFIEMAYPKFKKYRYSDDRIVVSHLYSIRQAVDGKVDYTLSAMFMCSHVL
jgi:hypothetical protein